MAVIIKNGKEVTFDKARLSRSLTKVFEGLSLDKEEFVDRMARVVETRGSMTYEGFTRKMKLTALEEVSQFAPEWDKVATRLTLKEIYKEARHNRQGNMGYYALVQQLVDKGIFTPELLEKYTHEELAFAGALIDTSRDDLFNFAGLTLLTDRYCARGYNGELYELPQERWLTIAVQLMMNETENRLEKISEAYWALSNLYMTVATPTLSNAGKSFGQFSSCFIDTVDDSLRGIYDSNTDFGLVSKSGGGMGIYMGKVRAHGSDIKGFKGASGGVVPWIKQANNTAVSVDQLGKRQGAVAIYLDVWHADIFSFLELKLNNGDERNRAHDIFTGVCLPDLFMERVRDRGEWHLFDPHEVRQLLGFSLEDFYDEEKGSGSFREKYEEAVKHPMLSRETVPAIDVMKAIMRSQLETGTPYMFYRDEVNRTNPNKHEGMIYASNLCSEISQNTSATTVKQEVIETRDGKNQLVIVKEMGDFVVCNLSSINLGRAVPDNVLKRLIPIQVRMLDNVIDLNESRIEIKQAVETNRRYRAIGLGTFGLHHLLALKGIRWESQQAVDYNDELYADIAFLTIQASAELAKEKGSYPLFEGSEWQTGEYFERRGYDSPEWKELAQLASEGMRNGYLMAVAPNSSTSIIAGSTASIDPVFKKEYAEEKKGMKVTVVVPDLNDRTRFLYKSGYHIDQHWSIDQNSARQKHVDQAISFNLYVPNDIKASELLALHLHAWEANLKTTYYTRSTSQEVIDECDACQ